MICCSRISDRTPGGSLRNSSSDSFVDKSFGLNTDSSVSLLMWGVSLAICAVVWTWLSGCCRMGAEGGPDFWGGDT